MAKDLLQIEGISKVYPDGWKLEAVNLNIEEQEILCLLGPSGCGKTTLLRLIAGLEEPDSGSLILAGRDISQTPVHQRGIGLMFQDYALFPHLNVSRNVAFGLEMQGLSRKEIEKRSAEALALVGMERFADRDTTELSGGEKQRIALARSLAPNPRLLMLDEPLGALDRAMRERLMIELRDILRRVRMTAIYVTHDQTEAFSLADRVVVMNGGRIEQAGAPEEVYHHPVNEFVARFLGLANLIPIMGQDSLGRWQTELGEFISEAASASDHGRLLLIRPNAEIVGNSPESTGSNIIRGTLAEKVFRGGRYRLSIETGDNRMLAFDMNSGGGLPQIGDRIDLYIDPDDISVIA